MAETEKVLSQAEIDAMLASSSRPQAAPPEAAPAEAAPPEAAPPQAAPAEVAGLLDRLDRLEEAVIQVGRQSSKATDATDSVTSLRRDLEDLFDRLHKVSSKVDIIEDDLEGTIGYRVKDKFVCKECHSEGLVATRLMCTNCGKKVWRGWYP